MSEFSKNSAWAERDNLAAYHDAQRIRNRSAVPKQPHEAAPKTVSVPLDVLERWLYDLEVSIDAYQAPELEDMKLAMRSYLPG